MFLSSNSTVPHNFISSCSPLLNSFHFPYNSTGTQLNTHYKENISKADFYRKKLNANASGIPLQHAPRSWHTTEEHATLRQRKHILPTTTLSIFLHILYSSHCVVCIDFASSLNLDSCCVVTQNVAVLGWLKLGRIRKPREDCFKEYQRYSILYGPSETLSTADFFL